MSRSIAKCSDVVVPLGLDISNVIDVEAEHADAEIINIQAPAVLVETSLFEVSQDGVTFVTAQNSTAFGAPQDLAGPAAGKARDIPSFVTKFWRLKLSAPAAAERTFKLTKAWNAW